MEEKSITSNSSFPLQAIPTRRKTDKWAKKCVDSVENVTGTQAASVRTSIVNKRINFDLFNGILHKEDIEKLMNPDSFEDDTINTEIQHNPILISKFNVIIGEDAQRRFEPHCIVTNPDAVSDKEAVMKKMLQNKVMALLEDPNLTDDQKQEELKRYQKFLRYEFQDVREVRANRILKYLTQKLRLKKKFNDGLKNTLICAEEIYEIDEFGHLEFNVLRPENVFTLSSGESNRIEDADVIIIRSYRSIGQIVDRYHQELSGKDIRDLEKLQNALDAGDKDYVDASQYVQFFTADTNDPDWRMDDLIDLTALNQNTTFGDYYDSAGNIRELRVLWRSKKPYKLVKYPDPNTGEELEKYMPEYYQPDTSKGETATLTYLNYWWEGTKLGKSKYVRLQPKKTQYFRMDNPSLVSPGIIGTVSNTNGGRGVSMMDRVKPYQYLYDVVWDRLRDAFITYMGPIMEMDMAKVPDGWSFQKWLFYARKMKIAAVNSFNVGNKGPAKGKLAGTFNTSGKVLNMDIGNYIQQMTLLLQFIETQISLVTGVTRQREGQVQNRETAQGIERSVEQSSAITESLILEHEETVIRALGYLVEAAKNYYRGKKFLAQYFLDDGSIHLFDFDGDEFSDADYDVVAVSGLHIERMRRNMEQLAHAGLQNEMITFSTLLDIYMAPSMQDMRRSIEASEQAKMERDQKRFETEQETVRKKIEQDAADKQADRDLDWDKAVLASTTDIEQSLIQAEGYGFEDNDADIQKLEQNRQKLLGEMKELDLKLSKQKEQSRQLDIDNEKRKTRNKRQASTSS